MNLKLTNKKAVFWNLDSFLRSDMTRKRDFWTWIFFSCQKLLAKIRPLDLHIFLKHYGKIFFPNRLEYVKVNFCFEITAIIYDE